MSISFLLAYFSYLWRERECAFQTRNMSKDDRLKINTGKRVLITVANAKANRPHCAGPHCCCTSTPLILTFFADDFKIAQAFLQLSHPDEKDYAENQIGPLHELHHNTCLRGKPNDCCRHELFAQNSLV